MDSPGKSTGVGSHFLLQGISRPRDKTRVSLIVDGLFTTEPPGKMPSGSLLGVVSLGPFGPPLSWQGGSHDYSNFLDKDLRVTREAFLASRPWFWRRKWHLTSVSLRGRSHRQRSLVGYSPWGRKESDTT